MLKNFTYATAAGALLGALLVWWSSPRTNSGATLLVVGCILLCLIVGAVYSALVRRVSEGSAASRGAEPHA